MLYLLGPLTRKRCLLIVLRNQRRFLMYLRVPVRIECIFLSRMYVRCTGPAIAIVVPGDE